MKGFAIYLEKNDISELVESIALSESIDDISYQCNIDMVVTKDLGQRGIKPAETIRVIDEETKEQVFTGVLWDLNSIEKGQKHISVSAFDRMKYLEESEDEYLFPEGQTATQRIQKYCSDWGIPMGNIPNTGVLLAKAVYRQKTIRDMMQSDIKETAAKGGKLYKLRMGQTLDLFEIGNNKVIQRLIRGENPFEIAQQRTLNGAVTQVKVLGAEKEGVLSPVITIEKKGTEQYGTIQKIIQNEKITDAAQGKAAAASVLSGIQETIGYKGLDISTIRAGDKVMLHEWPLLVVSVSRTLGRPGSMNLTLSNEQYIRRRFFGGDL